MDPPLDPPLHTLTRLLQNADWVAYNFAMSTIIEPVIKKISIFFLLGLVGIINERVPFVFRYSFEVENTVAITLYAL